MLTGDSRRVAEETASSLGIDEVYSELLPGDKVAKVEELLAQKPPKEKLAFVGDGINDAPVLSRADIGIAMGALGSDAAIEAADVVLMDDDPLKIAKAIRISRKCLRIVYENIVFAIGIKLICLVLGALGLANMWLAIFADVGVMILAVLNAIRALFTDSRAENAVRISAAARKATMTAVRAAGWLPVRSIPSNRPALAAPAPPIRPAISTVSRVNQVRPLFTPNLNSTGSSRASQSVPAPIRNSVCVPKGRIVSRPARPQTAAMVPAVSRLVRATLIIPTTYFSATMLPAVTGKYTAILSHLLCSS